MSTVVPGTAIALGRRMSTRARFFAVVTTSGGVTAGVVAVVGAGDGTEGAVVGAEAEPPVPPLELPPPPEARGVTAADADEAVLFPALFVATTVNV